MTRVCSIEQQQREQQFPQPKSSKFHKLLKILKNPIFGRKSKINPLLGSRDPDLSFGSIKTKKESY